MIVFGGLFILNLAIWTFTGIFAAIGAGFLTPLLSLINGLLALVGLILWVLLMIKAYQGEKFKLPVIGDIAEKNTEK
jgi:uncharacterized membrane protein